MPCEIFSIDVVPPVDIYIIYDSAAFQRINLPDNRVCEDSHDILIKNVWPDSLFFLERRCIDTMLFTSPAALLSRSL